MSGRKMAKSLRDLMVAACVWAGLSACASAPDAAPAVPPLASAEEVSAALEAFQAWSAAYQSGDYNAQFALTHPLIRQWGDATAWRRLMRDAARRNGALVSLELEGAGPLSASDVPCTEMGHCYRRDMQVVMIVLRTRYERADPAQPEYVVMANSDEGWRFGGGTFPNRPRGETMAILDRADEARIRVDRNSLP